MDNATIAVIAKLERDRDALLAQLATTDRAAGRTLALWAELNAAVAEDGAIGSVWPEAGAANQQLIADLGDSVPRVLAALAEMQAAAGALQQAGEAMDPPLDLLGL